MKLTNIRFFLELAERDTIHWYDAMAELEAVEKIEAEKYFICDNCHAFVSHKYEHNRNADFGVGDYYVCDKYEPPKSCNSPSNIWYNKVVDGLIKELNK